MTQEQALAILQSGVTVFLTGEPGSGKTYTVNAYTKYLRSARIEYAITASTGIAATHVGGITIHSWSGLGIKTALSDFDLDAIATKEHVVRRVSRARVLIIDEISMLDADVVNSIDKICREVRQVDLPFGGMQVVFVGDFFQLPPVTKNNQQASFAFESQAWVNANPVICYLSEQHRQSEESFLDLLSALRRGEISDEHRECLNQRCTAVADGDVGDVTRLYSHNANVDQMNDRKLSAMPTSSKTYQMSVSGREVLVEQLIRGCISPQRLSLKEGACVMFTKNSPKGQYVNGTLGVVVGFDKVRKFPIVETKDGRTIEVVPADWSIEDNGRILARISQIPLRLAWAITVHKSQGMSLDMAQIDLRSAFVAGQGYVALSRVRSLEGLFLEGYNEMALAVHPLVLEKDREFRGLSLDASAVFDKMSKKELRELHKNFVKSSDGVWPVKEGKKKKSEKISVYSVELLRKTQPKAYAPWDSEDDLLLKKHHEQGTPTKEIASMLGRGTGAIRSRVKLLRLE